LREKINGPAGSSRKVLGAKKIIDPSPHTRKATKGRGRANFAQPFHLVRVVVRFGLKLAGSRDRLRERKLVADSCARPARATAT
jgi:hypothetical protein